MAIIKQDEYATVTTPVPISTLDEGTVRAYTPTLERLTPTVTTPPATNTNAYAAPGANVAGTPTAPVVNQIRTPLTPLMPRNQLVL
jgi:hypothetical protein